MKISKKLLSAFLALILLTTLVPAQLFAQTDAGITAFVSISRHGEFVTGKDGKAVAALPVSLTGQSSFTLDDALRQAHALYYDGGAEAGYGSYTHETYGLSLSKLWGDESGMFGYQVNRGTETVLGLSHPIEDGAFIDAYLNQSVWPENEAYARFTAAQAETYTGGSLSLMLETQGYDGTNTPVYSPCANAVLTVNGADTDAVTDAEGNATLSFDEPGTYIVSAKKTKTVPEAVVTAITAPVCVVSVMPDAAITIPADTSLFVGQKGSKHFVSFTEMLPYDQKTDKAAGTTTYYYTLTDNSVYNYRIESDRYITYAGKFKKTENFRLSVTEDMLASDGKTKTTLDRDVSSNSGYNTGDIYLNINAQGYLKLTKPGDTYQITPLRNWEAVDGVTANYFIEPDFHYTVTDENGTPTSDVVTIDENGLLTAQGIGTAIALVTYDALNFAQGVGGPFFGAIWPENTGVFVVSVGAEESGIETGMTINAGRNDTSIKLSGDSPDAEHDVIYFTGDSGSFSFTPQIENCTVFVANPTVDTALHYSGFTPVPKGDAGFTVPLTEGRNIVKIAADGKAEYQVITAKKVTVTVNGGELVHPGDPLRITFDTLYHPANKLAGVYNMNALPIYTSVSGCENVLAGGLPAQYNFSSSKNAQTVANILKEKNQWGAKSYEKDTDLVIPEDYTADTFTLSGGMLYVTGWGDPYGNHRGITPTDGKAPNLSAASKDGWLGQLPDIEIPIMQAALTDVTVDTQTVKTEYLAGDPFDTDGLLVTAKYDDGTEVHTKNYTVSPETLSMDTEAVTISYRGKTVTVPVKVSAPRVSAIAVTTPPSKTDYKAGEVFDPTGMVVTATYENGTTGITKNYSYAPNRELKTTDEEITVTYGDTALSATVPISVSAASGGTASSNISVYFTLLGDEMHGAPSTEADTHTSRAGNLDTWMEKTKITVRSGSTVMEVVKKALGIGGIPYENPTGDYMESIRGLGEMDNGSLSGWMYTINGVYPEKGVSEQTVKSGDKIVFHYTDDYTQEKSAEKWNSSSSGGSSLVIGSSTKTPDTAVPKTEESPFADVETSAWYYDAVQYVTKNALMQGTGEGFAPEKEMTRAMLVTVLYRLEGETKNSEESKFTDVAADAWYADAVVWAAERGIVLGVSDTHFAPDAQITREQMAAIFHRYASRKGYITGESTAPDGFTDAKEISDWAIDAMAWVVGIGLMEGTSEAVLSPKGTATRAQVATILMRFCDTIVKNR